MKDIKRLFFGLEVEAAWNHPLPEGRILKEENRHVTLVFLGDRSLSGLLEDLKDFPDEGSRLGLAGKCNHLLFLPKRGPHVVAAEVDWLDPQEFLQIHQGLTSWLSEHGHAVESRELLAHVTMARTPFHAKEWKEAFTPFPLITKSLHLYESLGNLNYKPVWSLPFLPPIEEIEHTADIAYRIRAQNIPQLFLHAQIALAFKFPAMLPHFSDGTGVQNLDDVIIHLNGVVSRADAEVGCPFKAVSFHGKIIKDKDGFLLWEMIVDV